MQQAVAGWAAILAPATVEVVYSYTSALFKAAVGERLIRESPCTRIRLPANPRGRITPLTVPQVHTTADRVRPQYRGMVLLGAATGLRPGELRGLTVDRLVFADGGLRVRVDRQLTSTTPGWGPPKTSSSVRTVTTDQETAVMLRRHIAEHPPHPSGLIFTGRTHQPLSRSVLSEVWHRATDGLGLPARTGWHELRHFHASMLIAGGLSVVAVSERLGHKDATETLQTYGHLWHDDDDRAAIAVTRGLWDRQPPQSPRLTVVAGQ